MTVDISSDNILLIKHRSVLYVLLKNKKKLVKMIKIKIYGALIALIYSFFFSIVAHIGNDIPKEEMAARSQVRQVSIQSIEKLSISLRAIDVRASVISDRETTLIPLYLTIDIREKIKVPQLSGKNERVFLSRALSTEKYRVLRN